MNYGKAMQAALTADKERQTLRLWHEVLHTYGVDAYHQNQAYNWWGWSL